MSVVMRSARGASAFTQADRALLGAAGVTGPVFSGIADALAHTWGQLIDELLRIRNLQDDWDGEGTEAPHPALVDGAITLAQTLEAGGYPPAERVIASVNGTIYFEWHAPQGYQEIEVTSPLDAEYRWVPTGSAVTTVIGLNRRP
jgi:hypothetical protein